MIIVDFLDFASLCLGDVKPRETFLRKVLFSRRLKLRGTIEGADMKMRFCRSREAFASQRRSASSAKSAPRSPGRGIELGYLAFGDRVGRTFECDKNRSRCAGVSPATLAMAPIDSLWFTGRNETHRATQTATFELLGRAAHNLILPSS